MIHERNATKAERIRGWIYKYSLPILLLLAGGLSIVMWKNNLLVVIIKNSTTLAVTGAAIAAFLFTIQSVLISVPKDNPFMQYIRMDGRYFVYIHRFCRMAEIGFLIVMIPMFYMAEGEIVLDLVVFTIYVSCLLLTIWSMSLMGKILIISERQTSR